VISITFFIAGSIGCGIFQDLGSFIPWN